MFSNTGISCKNILANFFYCNICFNNNTNYLISYNGRQFNLDNVKSPGEFTNSIIKLISSMPIGSKEYSDFLNSQENNFQKKKENLFNNI